tara:strand:- start:1598 stop:4789 length:3192 start_codon:yes stop_codon:yes gene_type:complete
MIEKIIEISERNRFLVFLFVAFGALAGYYAMTHAPLDAIPDLSDVQVIVFSEWPGRSPDLVEDQITYPIVTSLLNAPNIKYVRGQSFFGLSFVYVVFEDGTDMYWARSRVLEYMNQVGGQLPEGIKPEIGPDATGVGWVYEYALVDKSGKNNLQELRSYQDWTLRYELSSIPGVAEVASIGGYVKQYQVELDPRALQAFGVSVPQVIKAIRASTNDVGGRIVEMSEIEYMVRGRGYITSLEDLKLIPIKTNNAGVPVLLEQLTSSIQLGPDMRRGAAELNGEGEVVGGIVVMRYGENALQVINRIKERIELIKPSLPEGVEIVSVYDRSSLINRAIENLKSKLIEEIVIVSIVILIFLFHFRSALVSVIGLPIGVLLSFIPMYFLGVTTNIMSLGGIAIAIGAMIDGSIVIIENVHKKLEHFEEEKERRAALKSAGKHAELEALPPLPSRNTVLLNATKEVGKPIFFALLVIAVSFTPVFALEAQSGRLFKPLAFTKTFSMFFGSLLAITLTPALLGLLIRGKILPEKKNPVNRFLIWAYNPFVHFALHFKWLLLAGSVVVLALTIIPITRIGSEFMPPLNEGSLLYMPSSVPGISIDTAIDALKAQDAVIKSVPEVETAFGKVGRARSATDPAPLSMTETTIELKDESQWREGMTFEKIQAELKEKLNNFPGMPAMWWMPIQTRTEMLSTGIRSNVGIKILGPNLNEIQNIAEKIEGLMSGIRGASSVFAERVTGGYYIDFTINRPSAARFNLTVEDIELMIETAIGGKNVAYNIEGRERYPINIRYPRDFRKDPETLGEVLIPIGNGQHIPIKQVADIKVTKGPPSIRDENGRLAGFVYVDVDGRDIGGFVQEAKEAVKQSIKVPPGYIIEWAGQYTYMESAAAKLRIVIPITLLIIFLLIYFNFKSITETLIVMLSVPFSLVGGYWLLYLLGYNMSVAVAVGFIALAGVAAQTGIVMIIYLDEAFNEAKKSGKMKTLKDLEDAIIYGAVQRVRPKMMTVTAMIAGLLPIMLGGGTGSQVMKRIATPMVGGLITSTILTLFIIPAIYLIWKWTTEVKDEKQ